MLFLLFNITFSSAITLFLKIGEKQKTHQDTVTSVNYLFASVFALILFFMRGGAAVDAPLYKWLMTVGFSLFTGTMYLMTLALMIRAISTSGAGMCTLWNKAGILIPIFTSLVLWGEAPKTLGWIGVVFTLAAVFLASYTGGAIKADKYLVALMLCSGIGSTSLKVFQKTVTTDLNDFFVFCTFFSAFLASVVFIKKRGGAKLNFKNIFFGAAVGFSNVTSDVFMLMALMSLPAAVVYPVSSSGTISFIALISALVFKEKLTKKQILALILTVIGIILINM